MNTTPLDFHLRRTVNAMTSEERLKFLDAFVRFNPHWRGAEVADVLDELDNTDSHCGLIELRCREFPNHSARDVSFATLATIYIYEGEHQATVERIGALLNRMP